MTAHRTIVRGCALLAIGIAILAGESTGHGQEHAASDGSIFANLRFRDIGPATMSGRIDDFAVLEADPSTFYVATATGGLWKTTNNGTTFEPVFDGQTTSSIGDVAVAPTDADLVWVGTGENNNRQSSSWGDGVYRSTDGGASWRHMGLTESRHVNRIVIDPIDHDIVYVAAGGNLWASGGDRGVYKTIDGGLTWQRVLHVDDDTGAGDLVMDPSNRNVLYAATYQRRRTPWGFNGGGPGSGIHKSTDAGATWIELTDGLPEGPKGRIGLDVYRADPDVVYARVEHADESGVYRSDDAGLSWTKMGDTNPRPMYFSQIRIDPTNDNRIYVLGVRLHVSDDGGRTFSDDGASRIHVDFHAMWIDPRDSRRILLGGDGGVGISYDRSETYVFLPNLPLAQFYHASYDMQTPFTVCGGLQDNNTWCGPSAVRSSVGIVNDDWFIIGGGDGFVALVDPDDPRIMYAESQGGRMNRVDRVTNERKVIRPEPLPDAEPYRWNWDTPLVMSPHDPATVFVAANRVFRSRDRGHSWEVVSPDLTRAIDRDELEIMGVAGEDVTIARNDGVGAFGTITTLAESPVTEGVYYAGSDDGVVQVSRDAGATWTDVTPGIGGLPDGTYVSRLAPSAFDAGTVYATFDGHRSGDFGTYVYASTDYGRSWTSMAADLPAGQVARTISEDLENRDVLYLGTETGVFVTLDRGRSWMALDANLPTVPIYEITLHPRDNAMILATHGRGIWILDDLAPLQELSRARQTDAHIFSIRTASQQRPANDMTRSVGNRHFAGENPPAGATITYYLDEKVEDLRLRIDGGSLGTVRELAGDAVADQRRRGINRVVWDLRVEPLPRREAASGGFGGGGLDGPMVVPGRYDVTLLDGDRRLASATLSVEPDPAIELSDADRSTHFDTALALHRLHGTANETLQAVSDMTDRLDAIGDALEARGEGVPDHITTRIESLEERLTPLRRSLGLAGREFNDQNVHRLLTRLKSAVMNSTSLPTATQDRQVSEVGPRFARLATDTNAAIDAMATLYADLAEAGLYPELPAPIPTGSQP